MLIHLYIVSLILFTTILLLIEIMNHGQLSGRDQAT
jgi:hypothetical protein